MTIVISNSDSFHWLRENATNGRHEQGRDGRIGCELQEADTVNTLHRNIIKKKIKKLKKRNGRRGGMKILKYYFHKQANEQCYTTKKRRRR